MKRQNKYYTLILATIIAVSSFGLTSCKKNFLDRQPLGRYTTDNYPYPTGGGPYDQYIYAAYSSLRDYYVTSYGYIGAVSIRSDDADKGSSLFDGAAYGLVAADNFPVFTDALFCNELWKGYYGSLIYKCNVVLQQIDLDSTGTPEDVKDKARGEARFLRGYAYFTLERLFKNIPIIDKVLDISQSNVPQSDSATVYAFIEQDLQFAAAHLPLRSEWDPKFIGRATSGAANGMLAKVYLYEKKWDQAMATAAIVINSGEYNLNTKYQDIFTDAGENCSESIFEIQCYADANNPSQYGCQWADIQGVRGVGSQDLGWGFNDPSHQLHMAYEPGDPRLNSTILFVPTLTPTRYGETFGRPEPNDSMYNMKAYTDPATRNKVGGLDGQHGWWVNVRILRYADVVLIYAEAANESGQTSEALDKLEWIRARARDGNNSILPKVTTTDQAQLRLAIQHERRIELAMENERFFDIVRWGIAADALHAAGKNNFKNGRDEILPIPQAQIDLSNGVLHQNPGY